MREKVPEGRMRATAMRRAPSPELSPARGRGVSFAATARTRSARGRSPARPAIAHRRPERPAGQHHAPRCLVEQTVPAAADDRHLDRAAIDADQDVQFHDAGKSIPHGLRRIGRGRRHHACSDAPATGTPRSNGSTRARESSEISGNTGETRSSACAGTIGSTCAVLAFACRWRVAAVGRGLGCRR